MTLRRTGWLCLAWLFGCSASAAEPLTLDRVLASAMTHFPRIQSAVQEKLASEGRLTRRMGAFDLALEQKSLVWADGFYDGASIDNRLTKALPLANARAYAGYRASNDDFPVYQEELATNGGGEFNLGVVFSLWRDRAIDQRRFAVSEARIGIEQAEYDLVLARLTTQRNSAHAYWQWVTAGKRLNVYEELVALARNRMSALEQRAAAGDVAQISVVENQQNLLRRQALARNARRDFDNAALELSLYWRDEDGAPLRPAADALPAHFPSIAHPAMSADELSELVLTRRPELARLERSLALEQRRLMLAENALMPRVDVGFKASHDLGGGSRTREGFEAIAELTVSIPLERRLGRGQVAESRAAINRLGFDRLMLENRLDTEIRKLVTTLDAARDFVEITRVEAQQAKQLEEAERIRFRAGDSDFFVVNLREERSADALLRNLESRRHYLTSLADIRALTLDFGADQSTSP